MSGRRGARPAFGRTIAASASHRKRVDPAPSGRSDGAKSMPSRHGVTDPAAGEGGGPPPTGLSPPCYARVHFEPFQELGETFPGDRRVPGSVPSPRVPAIPGSRARGGEGVLRRRDRLDFSGRGFNLFRGLRRDFRASVARRGASLLPACGEKVRMRGWVRFGGQSPRPLTPTLSPRSPGQEPGEGEGVLRRRARLDFSGRGINLFNGFRRIFRASVTAKPG